MAGFASVRMRVASLLTEARQQTLAGVIDQGVLSLGNLAVGLTVLRIASKEEYGLYGLCYMTVILLNGFSGALFGAQMTVSYYERPAPGRAGFAGAMLGSQLLLSGGLCLVALAGVALLPDAVLSGGTRRLVMVTILACPVAMAHDFFRTYFFLLHRAQGALGLDLMLTVLWAGLAVGFYRAGALPDLAALGGYGMATASTTAIALAWSRLPVRRGFALVVPTIRTAWQHGQWALGGVVVTALQNSAHVYLLGWLGTARAVADLNAARMLLAPMSLLILGANRTLLPRMAKLMAEDRIEEMHRHSVRTLGGLLAVILVYGIMLMLGRDVIIGDLLHKEYAGIGVLVLLWTAILLIQAVDANLSAVLQAGKRFRFLTVANLWTVVPVLVCAVPMIALFGAVGSLLTLAGGYVGLTALLWIDFRRVTRDRLSLRSVFKLPLPAFMRRPIPPAGTDTHENRVGGA